MSFATLEMIANAAGFAAGKHHGQFRKYTREPYVNHCAEVARILHEAGMPPIVIAAAWLHDVG
jgi:(p)ppGpp synthase/HD superfamily hydrolase